MCELVEAGGRWGTFCHSSLSQHLSNRLQEVNSTRGGERTWKARQEEGEAGRRRFLVGEWELESEG